MGAVGSLRPAEPLILRVESSRRGMAQHSSVALGQSAPGANCSRVPTMHSLNQIHSLFISTVDLLFQAAQLGATHRQRSFSRFNWHRRRPPRAPPPPPRAAAARGRRRLSHSSVFCVHAVLWRPFCACNTTCFLDPHHILVRLRL